MKINKNRLPHEFAIAFFVLCFLHVPAHAGRPLHVEDAGINEKGHGHIETWYYQCAEKTDSWHVSPAFAPTDWLEVAGLFTKNNSDNFYQKGLQAKVLLTPSRESGCNFGAIGGFLHTHGESHRDTWVTGIASCNSVSYGSVHINVGSVSLVDNSPLSWGAAYEKPVGPVTASIEYFGQRYSKSTIQAGLRGYVHPRLQLDGSIGRQGRGTILSIGIKIQL